MQTVVYSQIHQNQIEFKFGRYIDSDGSVRPVNDTGFRMTSHPAFVPAIHQPRMDTKVFPIEYHNDDLDDGGMSPFSSVKFFYVNEKAVEARNRGYVQENIVTRKRHEGLALGSHAN